MKMTLNNMDVNSLKETGNAFTLNSYQNQAGYLNKVYLSLIFSSRRYCYDIKKQTRKQKQNKAKVKQNQKKKKRKKKLNKIKKQNKTDQSKSKNKTKTSKQTTKKHFKTEQKQTKKKQNKTKQRKKQTKCIGCMLQFICITTTSVPVNHFDKKCFMHW